MFQKIIQMIMCIHKHCIQYSTYLCPFQDYCNELLALHIDWTFCLLLTILLPIQSKIHLIVVCPYIYINLFNDDYVLYSANLWIYERSSTDCPCRKYSFTLTKFFRCIIRSTRAIPNREFFKNGVFTWWWSWIAMKYLHMMYDVFISWRNDCLVLL